MGGILRRRLVLGNAVGQAIKKTFISVCFQFPHRGNSLQNIFNAKFKIFLFKAAFQLRACLLIRGRRIEYTLIYLSTYFSAEKRSWFALCYFSPKLIHTQSSGTTDTGCFIKLLIQFKVSLEWRCHSPFKSQAMYSHSTLDFSGPDQWYLAFCPCKV